MACPKGKQQSFLLSLHHPLVWINNVRSDHLEIPRVVLLVDSGRWVVGGHQSCTSHEFHGKLPSLVHVTLLHWKTLI